MSVAEPGAGPPDREVLGAPAAIRGRGGCRPSADNAGRHAQAWTRRWTSHLRSPRRQAEPPLRPTVRLRRRCERPRSRRRSAGGRMAAAQVAPVHPRGRRDALRADPRSHGSENHDRPPEANCGSLSRNRGGDRGVVHSEFAAVVGRPLDEIEDTLVERARRGDADAYEELVRRYTEMAFRAAYVVTGSAPDAEEAAQDAFVKAFRALHRFRAGAPFRPWLLRIVGNEARNRRRAAGRRTALELRLVEGLSAGGAAPSPEAAAEAAEERRALLRALVMVGDDHRQVVSCRYLLQLSVEETARSEERRVGKGCRSRCAPGE